MIGFFIGTSFLIHVISLAAIYLMYQQMQKINNTQTEEIDQLMQSYLEQIEQENSKLQDSLHKYVHPKEPKGQEYTHAQVSESSGSEKQDTQKQPWSPESLVLNNDQDHIETSLESRVLQLHHAGVPINDIAKQLHCGTTEASLIIQFKSND